VAAYWKAVTKLYQVYTTFSANKLCNHWPGESYV